jgi:ketosteroid isomerase-like protein
LLPAGRTARHSAHSNTPEHEHGIAGVDQLVELELKLIEDLGGDPEQGPDPIVSAVGPGHERTRIDHELHVRIHLCPRWLAGLIPVVGEALDDRHVLLRPRPPVSPIVGVLPWSTMPTTDREEMLRSLYRAFNARDVDACLAAMTDDVDWANGWEGGRVVGRDAVRDYWQRQWAAVDSTAEPTAVTERPDGTIEVAVHLVGRNSDGELLFDDRALHVYEFEGDLVRRMIIEK